MEDTIEEIRVKQHTNQFIAIAIQQNKSIIENQKSKIHNFQRNLRKLNTEVS